MLIGRENEIATLHGLMSSDESQFVAVYGRRRVGKTFLIREAYKSHFVFQHTGTSHSQAAVKRLPRISLSCRNGKMRNAQDMV